MGEREELFGEINKMRAELGMSPYAPESLQNMSDDELGRLHARTSALRQAYKPKSGSRARIVVACGIIITIIAISIAYFYLSSLSPLPDGGSPGGQDSGTPDIDGPPDNEPACVCDLMPDTCDDPECYCDPACDIAT